jgi:lysophospholipase L1-like esterase/protein tyrosine/serine phosphatase
MGEKNNIEKLDKKEQIKSHFPNTDKERQDLSKDVTTPQDKSKLRVKNDNLGRIPEYAHTPNMTRIEGGNLRGGSPGRFEGPRTVEKTERAVKKIYETFRPKTVITFEVASDYKDGMKTINAEIAAWKKLGVKVIHIPVQETEINRMEPGKTLEALDALTAGKTFIHCTHGRHRAVAFTEMWRAWNHGIDRSNALDDNNNYNTSGGHRECRKQAKKSIKDYLRIRKELAKIDTGEATRNAPIPRVPVLEERISKHAAAITGYTKNFYRIEGGNFRGASPGKRGMDPRTAEGIRHAVDTLAKKFPIKTVIVLHKEGKAERDRWRSHGVRVIYMPTHSEKFKRMEKEYPKLWWEAFRALNEGGAYVHCTHGSHRAVAFVELWRATRGIDRRDDLDRNRNFNGGQKHYREITKNMIPRYLAMSKGEVLRAIPETPEETAAKMTIIGDSIGAGIGKSIKGISPSHKSYAISGARMRITKEKKIAIYDQLDKVDPAKTPYLVIQGGTNDLNHSDYPPLKIAQELKKTYEKALTKGFKKISVVTIPPHTNEPDKTLALEVNEHLRAMAAKGEIQLYDLHSDYIKKDPELSGIRNQNVHPNKKGYKLLADLLVEKFKNKKLPSGSYAGMIGTELASAGFGGGSYEAFTSTEHQSEKSQKLQKALSAEIAKIDEATRAKDKATLESSSIKDIRFNTGLLNGNADEVQKEMHRRLAQYTTPQTDGSLMLNYNKFGYDHEMGIGLGDVLPPRYQRVLIITSGGSYRIGTRGLVPHKNESQRVGYKDEATGSYLATFTGDQIYVLDPPLTDKTKLAELLAQEKAAREGGKSSYSAPSSYGGGGGFSAEPLTADQMKAMESGEMVENPNLKTRAIKGLDANIANNRKFWNYDHLKIDGTNASWQYDPSISEGENIYNYSKAVCREHNMEGMISAVWGIVNRESGFNPWNATPRGSAAGLSQAPDNTWKGFIPRVKSKTSDPFARKLLKGVYKKGEEFICKPTGKYNKKGAKLYDRTPYALETANLKPKKDHFNYSRANPYLSIYHVIIGIKNNKSKYESMSSITGITDFSRLSVPDQLRMLYLSHHDGIEGGPRQLAFMRRLKQLGVDITNKEAVRQFIISESPESKAAMKLLHHKNQRSRIRRRAFANTDNFLRSWYSTCGKVVQSALSLKEKHPDTSIPRLRSKAEMDRAKAQAQQQPSQISAETPQIRIPTVDKTKFPGKTAILVLGNGPNPERNKYRARVGAEISLKMREVSIRPQLIFSGGKTGNRRISEAQEQYNHLSLIPRYRPLLTEKDNKPGIEDKATNTSKNISKTIDHLKREGFQNVIVVSHEPGRGKNHGRRGAKRLRTKIKNINITYWEPEKPDINNNFDRQSKFAQRTEPVKEVKSSIETEKPSLSTTELLTLFKSKDKTKINETIARYGYPSLKEIQSEVANMPAGAFVEDPRGVLKRFEESNQPLLTFDICSHYGHESTSIVLEFLDNAMKKQPPVPVMLFVTGNALSNPKIRAAIEEASQYNHISIQNHGFAHKPLSTTSGKEIYNVKGNSNVEDAYYEVAKGAILTESITGKRPKYYRSSTLYADSRGVKIANMLGLEMLGRTKGHGDHQKSGKEQAGSIVLRHAKKPSSIKYLDDVRERIRQGDINPSFRA